MSSSSASTTTAPRRPVDALTTEAIAWMVRLRSGHASAADQQDFARWQAASALHAQAWARITQAIDTPYAALRDAEARMPGQARALLLAPPKPTPSRRTALRALALAVPAGGALALLAERMAPLAALTADISTGTAERRTQTLADGSTLHLNARTLVDLAFTAAERRLHLRDGEVLLQAAPDAARPLVVATAQGLVRGGHQQGTRFTVRQEPGRTCVAALQHRVLLQAADGRQAALSAGEGAVLAADGAITQLDAAQVGSDAWLQGQLVVNRQPLAHVVAQLQRYRRGWLRVAPEVAALPVQGVLPLDDVDRAIAALQETLPIRVTQAGPVTWFGAA